MAATLWTPEWLRANYLFGVNLSDDYANDYPQEMWEQAMLAAEEWIRTELRLAIPVATFTERHDFLTSDSGMRTMIQVRQHPLKTITSLRMKIGTSPIMDIPADWIANYCHDQVQIVPSANTIAAYPLTSLGFFQITSYNGMDQPGTYEIVYTAGFTLRGIAAAYSQAKALTSAAWVPSGIAFNGPLTITLSAAQATDVTFTIKGADAYTGKKLDNRRHGNAVYAPETLVIPHGSTVGVSSNTWSSIESVTWTVPSGAGAATATFSGASLDNAGVDIPRDILDAMGKRAAIGVLDVAGDLIAGAGIANKSTGLDGVSQSVGTTSSATNAGYGARIIHYEQQLKRDMPRLRAKYQGVRLGVA